MLIRLAGDTLVPEGPAPPSQLEPALAPEQELATLSGEGALIPGFSFPLKYGRSGGVS